MFTPSTASSIAVESNYFSNTNIINATDVVPGPEGVPTCASVINGTDPKCVPWNIWVPNGVTKAATNYLSIPLLVQATTTEELVSGSITGDLGKYGIKLPIAEEGVKFDIGAEWRSESADFSPDLASQQGNAAGSGGAVVPVSGNFHVKEVFTELGIPLASHLPGAESLGVEAGYRYSDYSEGFKTNTYKIGAEWAPIQDVRFRASYQRAVRAPNILELFTPQAVALDGSTDPCAGTAAAIAARGITQAQCAFAGVSAAQFGNINPNPSQYQQFSGQTQSEPGSGKIRYLFGGLCVPTGFPAAPHHVGRLVRHQGAGHDWSDRR